MTTTNTRFAAHMGFDAEDAFPDMAMPRSEMPKVYRVDFDCPQQGRVTGKVIGTLRDITNGAKTLVVELDHQLAGIVHHVNVHDVLKLHIDFYHPSFPY